MLANSSAGEWNCDVLDDDQIKRALKGVLELQEQFHVQVQERVAAERERRRKESSAGLELPNFEVGDYVLYARVRRPGVTPKLMATWTGPWRVFGWCSPSASLRDPEHCFWSRSHGACCLSAFLRRFAAQRHRRCKECVSARIQSGLIQMAGIVRVAVADDRSLMVLVDWVGFEVDERTWEPFKEIFEAAPEFLAKELRKLRVTRVIAARIKSEFGIRL